MNIHLPLILLIEAARNARGHAVPHLKENPVCSRIGKASMSALRATTGLPLPSVPITPVLATGCLHEQDL